MLLKKLRAGSLNLHFVCCKIYSLIHIFIYLYIYRKNKHIEMHSNEIKSDAECRIHICKLACINYDCVNVSIKMYIYIYV